MTTPLTPKQLRALHLLGETWVYPLDLGVHGNVLLSLFRRGYVERRTYDGYLRNMRAVRMWQYRITDAGRALEVQP